jgi:predicted acyl esterase
MSTRGITFSFVKRQYSTVVCDPPCHTSDTRWVLTSNRIMPGHRIRLDVPSSNFPRFDVNPNTGEAIGRERRRVVADNTVFHERARESRVVLPIV